MQPVPASRPRASGSGLIPLPLLTDAEATPCLTEFARESDTRSGRAGFVHTFHTGSTVDGPGIRFVLFTTGCLMRCQYCHNPETWHMKDGMKMTATDVMTEVLKYERFMKLSGGGITISGGEPMVQAPFINRIFRAAKARGIHTTLDTNGYFGERMSDEDLEQVDLVLLDIKSFDPETHHRATGVQVAPVLNFAKRLSALGKPMWIRFVLVPGLTDDPENVEGLAQFVAGLNAVERVEVLPFHQMGMAKWAKMGRTYPLADTRPPEATQVEKVVNAFRSHGLNAF